MPYKIQWLTQHCDIYAACDGKAGCNSIKCTMTKNRILWFALFFGAVFSLTWYKCYLSPFLFCGYLLSFKVRNVHHNPFDSSCPQKCMNSCVLGQFFLIVFFLSFRVYNLLVADIMKTKLFYISYHTKYADLKDLLERSNHRSYPLVDSEGTAAIFLRYSFI